MLHLKRKYIMNAIATCYFVIILSITSCAPVQQKIAEIEAHRQLKQYRQNMTQGMFDKIVQQSNRALQNGDTTPSAEIALYALGEIYAHYDFIERDHRVSQAYFERLIMNFPDSPLSSEAKLYISLFGDIAASEEAVAEKEESLKLAVLSANRKEYIHVPIPREKVIKNKNFVEATAENLRILNRSDGKKPAERAIYNLGLIYAHVDNPGKNYTKSQAYFYLLSEKYPKSEYAEESRIWLGLLETIDKLQQIDIDIEQQKRKHKHK